MKITIIICAVLCLGVVCLADNARIENNHEPSLQYKPLILKPEESQSSDSGSVRDKRFLGGLFGGYGRRPYYGRPSWYSNNYWEPSQYYNNYGPRTIYVHTYDDSYGPGYYGYY